MSDVGSTSVGPGLDAPTPSAGADAAVTAAVVAEVRGALRDELDQVVPHVVGALKRQDAVADLSTRLDRAERRLAERDRRPLVAGIRRVLGDVRRLDLPEDAGRMIVAELEGLLVGAGYTEYGEVGERFDPRRHEALDGVVSDGGIGTVVEVLEPGLETLGEVVVTAKVRIGDGTTGVAAPAEEQA